MFASPLPWYLSRTDQIVARAERIKTSQFLRTIWREELVAVFHQLHPAPIFMTEADWSVLPEQVIMGTVPRRLQRLVKELFDRQLLLDDPSADQRELAAARERALSALDRPTILYLMLAQGCNFRCVGCPIPALAERHGDTLMSLEDAVAGIRRWQDHIADQPEDNDPYFVVFYGGEALLNREVFEQLLPFIAREREEGRLPRRLELMLTTNGSLVDERIARLCADHQVLVAVGLDGPAHLHNRVRVSAAGALTYDSVRRGIDILHQHGVRLAASVTITPGNFGELAGYSDSLRAMGISKFGYNLLKGRTLLDQLGGMSLEEYARSAARLVLSGLADAGDDGSCFEYQLEKKLKALQHGVPSAVDCTCYGNQLVVQADGQITNCPFLRVEQGHVRQLRRDFRIARSMAVQNWRKRIPILREPARAKSVLDGGGCAWSSSELGGYGLAEDRVNAIFTEELTHGLIWSFLPSGSADELRSGKSAYWSHRRLGPVHAS